METNIALPNYIETAYYDPEIEGPAPGPQRPNRDRRPEYVQYRDDGCDLAPKCLSCPLPKCQYDDAGWLDRKARKRRDREILEAWRKERPKKKALAARFGLNRRTVHRILREADEGYSTTDLSKDSE